MQANHSIVISIGMAAVVGTYSTILDAAGASSRGLSWDRRASPTTNAPLFSIPTSFQIRPLPGQSNCVFTIYGTPGLDAGHSLSFYERMWLHAWFAGAAMVTPENSLAIFFEKAAAPWMLTAHGRNAAEVFQFIQAHDRGVPFTPVAILLDHLAGYNGYMDKPWGILEPTEGDRQVRDLLSQP